MRNAVFDYSAAFFAAAPLGCSQGFVERVTDVPHSPDGVLFALAYERLAKSPDMRVHGSRVDLRAVAPDAHDQALSAEHVARSFHEMFERTECCETAKAILFGLSKRLGSASITIFSHRGAARRCVASQRTGGLL